MEFWNCRTFGEDDTGFGRFFVFREGEQLPPASSGKPVNRSGKDRSPVEKPAGRSEKPQIHTEKPTVRSEKPHSNAEKSRSNAEKPKNPVLKLAEYLKARNGKKIESVTQRVDLGVEEDMITSPEADAQDAVEKISYARKAIDRKQEAYFAAVRKMYFDGVKGGADDIALAKYIEKSALAFQELVGSYEEVVQIQENSVDPELTRKLAGELLQVEIPLIENRKVEVKGTVPIDLMDLADSAGTASRGGKPAAPKTGAHKTYTKNEVVRKTSVIPGDTGAYRAMQNGAEMAVVNARANLFLLTGDRKYEKYYARDIQHRNKNLSDNAAGAIEKAEQADAKGLTKLEKIMFLQSNEEKYRQLNEYARTMGRRQLEIEKLRISDPVKAYGLANEFYRELDNLQKEMSGLPAAPENSPLPKGLDISVSPAGNLHKSMNAKFFEDLRKSSPKVAESFSQLLKIAHGKTATLARDIFQKDPEIRQFQNNLAGFMKSGEGLFKTFDALMKDLEQGETPSKPYMAKIHEDIERYTGSSYFKSIRKAWPLEKYRGYLANDTGLIPGGRKLIGNLSRAYDGLNEYITTIENIAGELNDIDGDYAGFSNGLRNLGTVGPRISAFVAMLRSAGKFAILIGACVATGQGLTAIKAGYFATISTISAVSTLSGAGLEYLDGNKGAFNTGSLIEGYAQGVVMSAASGVLAKPMGAVWGTYARNLNNVFAKSRFDWLRKFAERGYVEKIFSEEEKNSTVLRKFLEELGEESVEEGLESVGRAIAPHDPWVGFMFSLLGSSAKTAKGVFKNGKFEIGGSRRSRPSIRGEVTDSGIKLEYSDLAAIKEFLKTRGLDAESLAKLEADGELTVEKDGVKLEVRKVEGEVNEMEQVKETRKVDYGSSLLGKLLQSGDLILGRFADIESGFLNRKLESLKRHAGIGRFTSADKARAKLISLMESDSYKFRPIWVSIEDDGQVAIYSDGNVRIYAAIIYDVDPKHIPVYCSGFGTNGENVANTTLREVLDKAAVVRNTRSGGRTGLERVNAEAGAEAQEIHTDPSVETSAKREAIFDKKMGLWRYRVEAPDPANVLKWKAGTESILSMLKSTRSLKEAIGGGSDLSPEMLKYVNKFQEILDAETMDENDLKLLAISLYIIREKGKFSDIMSNLKSIKGGTFKVEDVFEKENYTTCIDAASAVKVLAEAMGITGEIVGPGKIGHRYFRSSEGKIVDFIWWKRGGLFQTEEKFREAIKGLPLPIRLMVFQGFFTAKTDSQPDRPRAATRRRGKIRENETPEPKELTAEQIETLRTTKVLEINDRPEVLKAVREIIEKLRSSGKRIVDDKLGLKIKLGHKGLVIVAREGVAGEGRFLRSLGIGLTDNFYSSSNFKIVINGLEIVVIKNPSWLLVPDESTDLKIDRDSLMESAKSSPGTVLYDADLFMNEPYAEEIIRAAAGNAPAKALEYAFQYADRLDSSVAEEIIRAAAEKDPRAAVLNGKKYLDQPYGKNIFKVAATRIFEEDPVAAVLVFEGWMKEYFTAEEFESMTGKAVAELLDTNPYILWMKRLNYHFSEDQWLVLQRRMAENIRTLDFPEIESVIWAFLDQDTGSPIDKELAYSAIERYIQQGRHLLRDINNSDPAIAHREKRFQDFILEYVEHIAADIKLEKNAMALLYMYDHIQEQHEDREFELKTRVLEAVEKNKAALLQVLTSLRDRILTGGTTAIDSYHANMIRQIAYHGVSNYKFLDVTAKYLNMLLEMSNPEIPVNRSDDFIEITTSLLAKFAKKDRKKEANINYSHADYVSFYEKCLALSPSVGETDAPAQRISQQSVTFLQSFDTLTTDRGNFQFMQEQVFNIFNITMSLLTNIKDQAISDKIENSLAKMQQALAANTDPVEQRKVLEQFNTEMKGNLAVIFDQAFGLKDLPELTPEIMESITPYLNYYANIHERTAEQTHIIAYFMLLRITGQWDAFKRGEAEVDAYMNDAMREQVHQYLENRSRLDILNVAMAENPELFPDGKRQRWMQALTEKSQAILIGQSGGVTDVLGQVERGYRDLEDPDNFSDSEKALMAVVREHGSKAVGNALRERFKDPAYTDEVIVKLGLDKSANEKEILPVMQKVARILGSLARFTEAVEKAELQRDIAELEAVLIPGAEVIRIFAKIGEEMSTKSGAAAVTEDIEYLESILHKKQGELTPEELQVAQGYLDTAKEKVLGLYKKVDALGKEFAGLWESASKTGEISETLKSRLEVFSRLFVLDKSDRKVTYSSTMTGDLAEVIPHIRACLECMSKAVNNDTNLTFGDRNRFSIITREHGMPEGKSLSDELVTLQKTVDPETGEVAFSFVMDNVYGHRNRDILVANVLTVMKKAKELQRILPEVKVNVFVTQAALSSCSVDEAYLSERLKDNFGKFQASQVARDVHIAQSASGDGHYEIGGDFGGRVSSGVGRVGGIEITLPIKATPPDNAATTDRTPATVMPSADQDFQDSDSLSVRVKGRPETEDYSRKEVRQAKTEELKARLARGEISRKEYGAERAQILRRAYLDLMTHIITDAENFVTENPDARAKEITAHLIAMAKNRGLEPSTLQKDMMTIAARKYVKERRVVKKISDALNDPNPVKARRAKIRLLKGADLSFVNPDDITILTDRPDTLTLIFAKTEDYERAFKGGATLTEVDITRGQQSEGFFSGNEYTDKRLNGKLTFVKKTSAEILIHEEQHSWFMRYFDYRLYLNPSERSSQIMSILGSEMSMAEKIEMLKERGLVKFPKPEMTDQEMSRFIEDTYHFENAWRNLKDETVAYLKGGQFQHKEIPLVYSELRDINFRDWQFKIRLTKVFDCLKYDLERLSRQRFSPKILAQIVQTAETPNDAVMRLRALGKPKYDQAKLSKMLLDLDEAETEIYLDFLHTDNLAGLESSLDQKVYFLMDLRVDYREIRLEEYAKLKSQVLAEIQHPDLNSFLAVLESMKLRRGTGRIMMWRDRVQMLQEWYNSRKNGQPAEATQEIQTRSGEAPRTVAEDKTASATSTLDRFKSAITAKYGEVSPLTPEIEAGIRARYEHYEALTREVSTLPKAYRERAQAIIDERKAKIEKTLQELLDKRHSFGAKVLTRKDGLTFKDLIEAHEKISKVEKAIGELPREFQGNLIEWLEERRQVFIGLYNGDSSLQMTTLDKNLEWIEKKRKYVMENPDMAHFALEKFGKLPSRQQMESLQPLVKQLAEFKEIFHQLEAVEALIRAYPELQVHQETLYAIKALKNIADGQVSEETMFAEGGHNLSTRITRMMDLAGRPEKLEILMKFDREIGRKLSPNQKSEITRLYFEMVIHGKLTHDVFRERVTAYGKTHENLSTLSALSPVGREQYAANAARSLENFLVEKIVQKGMDPQVVEEEIREKYAEIAATAEVSININYDPLTTVLEEGKFRTYEELDVKHREVGIVGKTGYGERRAARDREVGQGSGFVVGALSSQNGLDGIVGPAPFYGHGVVRLKPERIEDRVRFFEGDSLTPKHLAEKVNPNWLIRKWDDAQSRRLDHQGAILSKALMELELKEADATHAHTMYVEAHIAGGVTLEDIGSISYGVVDRSKERSELEAMVESSDPSYQARGKFRLEQLEEREAEKRNGLRNLQTMAETRGIPFEIRELSGEIRPVEDPLNPDKFRRQLAADEAYGNKVPKRPKLTAGITPQKIERMQWLLTYPDFNPADLISFMEAQLPIGAEFKRDVGVFEGYNLGQHTTMMMKQFEKYGLSHELGDVVENPEFLPFFRLFLSLHDIGKPRAVAEGNKNDQHKHTFEIMADVLPQLGVKPEMVKLAQALIMDDPLGKLIRGKISEAEAAEIVIKMAGYSGLSIKQFYPILRVFYKVDAASYTADAGGIASLDGMFQFGPGYLEFNSQIAEQLRSLRARINIITMPAVLPLMREHSGYVFNSIYTSEFARHCLSPDEFNKFEFYVAGQVTEADLIGSVNINKLAQVVVELGQQIEQNIKAVKAELAGFRKHFSENPEDLAEYAATFAPDGNDVMLAYVRGEIDEALVIAEIGLSNYDVAAETRKNVPLFSKAETVRVFIKLQNQVRSVESSQLGQDEKRSELELIEESKQILRDRYFGSEIHHGTSSLAWRGITSSGGKILSAAESQRRKINIATGERDIAGGSANHDVIYTGYHVDGYGTAEGYANLNTRSDGYRNPSTYTEVELSSRISAYRKAIGSLERQKLDKLPGLKVGGDLHTLKRELAGFEEALKMKQTVDVYADTAKPYPVVFGLKVDGLNIDAARTRDWGGFLSGEARVNEPAVSLVKNCDKIFVPREFMEAARKSLIEAVGQEAAEKIKIYSFEAMENAASPSMDKIVSSSYRNTFNDLDWQQTNRLNQIYSFANTP